MVEIRGARRKRPTFVKQSGNCLTLGSVLSEIWTYVIGVASADYISTCSWVHQNNFRNWAIVFFNLKCIAMFWHIVSHILKVWKYITQNRKTVVYWLHHLKLMNLICEFSVRERVRFRERDVSWETWFHTEFLHGVKLSLFILIWALITSTLILKLFYHVWKKV